MQSNQSGSERHARLTLPHTGTGTLKILDIHIAEAALLTPLLEQLSPKVYVASGASVQTMWLGSLRG